MGMTIDNCTKILTARLECMKRETSGTDSNCNFHICDECSLCYEQGTIGEQKKALKFAADTMRKYQKIVNIVSLNDEEFKQCSLKELKEILEVIADRSEEE